MKIEIMNMRKLIIVSFMFFLFIQIVLCQDKIIHPEYYIEKSRIYSSINYNLEISSVNGNYKIIKVEDYNSKTISVGNTIVKNNIITCIDEKTKQIVTFKKTDKYSLKVISKNQYFKNNIIIYLVEIRGSEGPIETLKWKNGIRHGYSTIWNIKGIKSILYEDGDIKETHFETWEEIQAKEPVL